MNNINETFRLLRIANNLTVKEISSKVGVSSSYISAIESGKRNPSKKIINKYSEILNVDESTINYFAQDSEDNFQKLLLKILKTIVNEE